LFVPDTVKLVASKLPGYVEVEAFLVYNLDNPYSIRFVVNVAPAPVMVASSLIVLGEQLPAPGVFQQPRVS
jgi:hypothetical protein